MASLQTTTKLICKLHIGHHQVLGIKPVIFFFSCKAGTPTTLPKFGPRKHIDKQSPGREFW